MMLDSFNQLAIELLETIKEIFPERKFDFPTITHNSKVAIKYMTKKVGKKTKMISGRDETVFNKLFLESNGDEVNARELWDTLTDEAKEDIWQKLNAMVLVMATVNNTPPELMNNIEELATEFGKKFEEGNLEMGDMMGEIFKRVQKMDLSSFKNTKNLEALTDSLGINKSDISNMIGDVSGINPKLLNTVSNLISDDGEEDILSILENARPPQRTRDPNKSSNKKKHKRKNN